MAALGEPPEPGLPAGLAVVDGNGRALPRETVLEAITSARADDLASWRVVATNGDEEGRGALP